MAKSDADILREARALIEDPARWTQGALAHSKLGRAVNPEGKAAVRWCAMGALYKAADRVSDTFSVERYLIAAARDIGLPRDVDDVNDSTDRATVLRMYDRAIELAEQSPTEAAQ